MENIVYKYFSDIKKVASSSAFEIYKGDNYTLHLYKYETSIECVFYAYLNTLRIPLFMTEASEGNEEQRLEVSLQTLLNAMPNINESIDVLRRNNDIDKDEITVLNNITVSLNIDSKENIKLEDLLEVFIKSTDLRILQLKGILKIVLFLKYIEKINSEFALELKTIKKRINELFD